MSSDAFIMDVPVSTSSLRPSIEPRMTNPFSFTHSPILQQVYHPFHQSPVEAAGPSDTFPTAYMLKKTPARANPDHSSSSLIQPHSSSPKDTSVGSAPSDSVDSFNPVTSHLQTSNPVPLVRSMHERLIGHYGAASPGSTSLTISSGINPSPPLSVIVSPAETIVGFLTTGATLTIRAFPGIRSVEIPQSMPSASACASSAESSSLISKRLDKKRRISQPRSHTKTRHHRRVPEMQRENTRAERDYVSTFRQHEFSSEEHIDSDGECLMQSDSVLLSQSRPKLKHLKRRRSDSEETGLSPHLLQHSPISILSRPLTEKATASPKKRIQPVHSRRSCAFYSMPLPKDDDPHKQQSAHSRVENRYFVEFHHLHPHCGSSYAGAFPPPSVQPPISAGATKLIDETSTRKRHPKAGSKKRTAKKTGGKSNILHMSLSPSFSPSVVHSAPFESDRISMELGDLKHTIAQLSHDTATTETKLAQISESVRSIHNLLKTTLRQKKTHKRQSSKQDTHPSTTQHSSQCTICPPSSSCDTLRPFPLETIPVHFQSGFCDKCESAVSDTPHSQSSLSFTSESEDDSTADESTSHSDSQSVKSQSPSSSPLSHPSSDRRSSPLPFLWTPPSFAPDFDASTPFRSASPEPSRDSAPGVLSPEDHTPTTLSSKARTKRVDIILSKKRRMDERMRKREEERQRSHPR